MTKEPLSSPGLKIEEDESDMIIFTLRDLANCSPEPPSALTFTRYLVNQLPLGEQDSFYDVVTHALNSIKPGIPTRYPVLHSVMGQLTQDELSQIGELVMFLKRHGIEVPEEQIRISSHPKVKEGPLAAVVFNGMNPNSSQSVSSSTILMQPPQLGYPFVATQIYHHEDPMDMVDQRFSLLHGFPHKDMYRQKNSLLLSIIFPGGVDFTRRR